MERITFGKRLAILRKTKGLTQQELAEILNVSNKTVSRWERDECSPDILLLPEIADIFGVTCDELLRREYETPKKESSEHTMKKAFNSVLSNYEILIWISIAIGLIGFFIMILFAYVLKAELVNTLAIGLMIIIETIAFTINLICVKKLKADRNNHKHLEYEEQYVKDKYENLLYDLSFKSFSICVISLYLGVVKAILLDTILTGGTEPLWSFLLICVVFIAIILPFVMPIRKLYIRKMQKYI